MELSAIQRNGESILAVTFYGQNRDNEVLDHQKKVFKYYGIHVNYIPWPFEQAGHGDAVQHLVDSTLNMNIDYYLFIDMDAIPTREDFFNIIYSKISDKQTIFGPAWCASHRSPNRLHAAGCFLAFAKDLYIKLGKPPLHDRIPRSDNFAELSFRAEELGYGVSLVYPKSFYELTDDEMKQTQNPRHWNLGLNGLKFGLCSQYSDLFFHAGMANIKRGRDIFIAKCQEILNKKFTYKDIKGWFDWEEHYKTAVENAKDGDVFVEIGTFLGKSTCFLANEIKQSGKKIKFYTVDSFIGEGNDASYTKTVEENGGNIYNAFLNNVKKCGVEGYVTPLVGTSTEISKKFENESINFLYVDGDHNYNGIKNDLENWTPKVKRDSVIQGHDFAEYAKSVIQAVTEKFGDKVIKPKTGTTWTILPPKNIELILACVNRSEYLDITLPLNKDKFNNITIVTDLNDNKTKDICNKYNVKCHQTNSFYEYGAKFNRGAAFNEVLNKINPTDWICFTDVDILFPDNFRDIVDKENLNKNTLYGGSRAFIKKYSEWIKIKDNKEELLKLEQVEGFGVGFMQIWNINSNKLKDIPKDKIYPYGYDVEEMDIQFLKIFHPDVKTVGKLPINCYHLGDHAQYKRNYDEFFVS